jgi:carbamoyltransferase
LRILGISAYYHDSAAALLVDGRIVAAAQEERFTRKKHDSAYPAQAINYCLGAAGIQLAEVDFVAFYDKPLLKFDRLLETYVALLTRLSELCQSNSVWLKRKLFQNPPVEQAEKRHFDWDERLARRTPLATQPVPSTLPLTTQWY